MMIFNLINALIVLALFLGICAGIIALQVFLSKKDSKWLGLILPAIPFGLSMLVIINLVAFMPIQSDASVVSMIDHERDAFETLDEIRARNFELAEELERAAEIEELLIERLGIMEYTIVTHTVAASSLPMILMRTAFIFLALNIPTGILLAIYASCRGTRNRRRDLDRMSVQDL